MGSTMERFMRLRRVTAAGQDIVLAGFLSLGALAQAGSLNYESSVSVAAAMAVVSTTAVGWRRRSPKGAAFAAVSGMVGYQQITGDPNMVFEPLAVVLTFYMVGRRTVSNRDRLAALLLLAVALGAAAAISSNTKGGLSPVAAILAWGPIATVPMLAGMFVAKRARLTADLTITLSDLAEEQRLRGLLAADEERNRVARELHDIVAHSLSVMVIQAGAARLVAADDPGAAHGALRVIAETGREAMADLRRIMGVLRRKDDVLGGGDPGLQQLKQLVDRVRTGGVPVDLGIEGDVLALPSGVSTTVYRVVQEALTNSIKHAVETSVSVDVIIAKAAVDVEVTDTGTSGGGQTGRHHPSVRLGGSGQGLIGMRQRVALQGGQLSAGPLPGGGWSVSAHIPLDDAPSPLEPPSGTAPDQPEKNLRLSWVRNDVALAVVALVCLEIEAVTSPYRRGPLALNMILVGLVAVGSGWRRRAPLAFLALSGVVAALLSRGLTSLEHATLTGSFTLVAGLYTVGAWKQRRQAVAALVVFSVWATAIAALDHAPLSDLLGAMTMGLAIWTGGRIIRTQRLLAADLQQASARLRLERKGRERLIVAGEQTRIAQKLHALVARGVVAMIVQAESAESLTSSDVDAALRATGEIEQCGRQALTDMRHILGALRGEGEPSPRQPQPRLGNLHTLVDEAGREGKLVELAVEGEPGTVLARVELIAYRIVEEIITTATAPTRITMGFTGSTLDLSVTGENVQLPGPVQGLVDLCDGTVMASQPQSSEVRITLPRTLEEVLL